MAKSLKKRHLWSSDTEVIRPWFQRCIDGAFVSGLARFSANGATAWAVAFFICLGQIVLVHAATATAASSVHSGSRTTVSAQGTREKSEETYQDLIQKAQNLTLQQDRLQTTQVLIRGIQRETRGSPGYRELVRVLEDLASVFYTEKAQNLFATAEALVETKPREAVDAYAEAYKAEDKNLTILKAMTRLLLRLDECEKADVRVRLAEEIDPYSAEVRLLRMQTMSCQKNYDALSARLFVHDPDLDTVERYLHGLQVADWLRHKEAKKAKAILSIWEVQSPDYPELYYWKWQAAKETATSDRLSAAKYSQLCQNLTARKRKSFSLDVDLCKGKDAVDAFLKEKDTPL